MSPLTRVEIKAIRTRLALSQEQFASLLGVSVSSVSGWERGLQRPDAVGQQLLLLLDQRTQHLASPFSEAGELKSKLLKIGGLAALGWLLYQLFKDD